MKRIRDFFASRRTRGILVLGLAGILFAGVTLETARACWNTVLIECFDRIPNQWPWQNPTGSGRVWRVCSVVGATTYCSPGMPATVARWHPHTGDFYDVLMCPDDNQSLWCYGYPLSNDPEYDIYPSSYNTYVTYGRLDLSQAVAARVVWSMWHRSELIYDSIFWGASKTQVLSDTGMKIGGSRWLETDQWLGFSMDLADLWNYTTGDSFSFLGEDTVYVFWRFRSNPNDIRDIGTFIDNVTISWDDGFQDLTATNLEVLGSDSVAVQGDPQVGDTLLAYFAWSVCAGSVENYDPYHVTVTVNELTVLDLLVDDSHAGDIRSGLTAPWVVTQPGNYTVQLKVDSLDQIMESNENNNVLMSTYVVPTPNPAPVFLWITPGEDTLFADTTAVMRWSVTDPDEQATVSIYYDNESVGCVGSTVPGGLQRPELDGIDSVSWDVRFQPNFRLYYLFARVTDSVNDTCIYAPWPLLIDHTQGAGEPPLGLIPAAYYLEQNYPNPFNPVTEIRYGIAVPGPVTLTVYDVLGRKAAVLVNDDREPGSYVASYDGAVFPSGIYLYVLTSPEGTIGRKMMLLK